MIKRDWTSSQGEFLFRDDATECHVGPVVIVSPQPASCKILNLVEGFKQMMGQPVVTHRAVI